MKTLTSLAIFFFGGGEGSVGGGGGGASIIRLGPYWFTSSTLSFILIYMSNLEAI